MGPGARSDVTRVVAPGHAAGVADPAEDPLTAELLDTSTWSDELVASAGLPVVDSPVVTVGGGLGSFALVDVLRIAGVPAAQLRVLTNLQQPHETYAYLARASQIPDHERLRSDSGSTIDNIWGWPGYALREALRAPTLRERAAPLLQVLVEPVLADYYTPRAADVYRSVEREAARVGWSSMVVGGQARLVRRRLGGGWFAVLTPPAGTGGPRRVAYRCGYLHLAVGYPGLRFLPDLQRFRERHRDFTRVVNAYERHDHVYEELLRRPGVVVLRGNGIVASRVLQRLIDDIEVHGARTRIVHLFRTFVHGPHGPSRVLRRAGGDGFAYQGFNWPKAAWGGQVKEVLEQLDDGARAELLGLLGGTTTAPRQSWKRQLRRAREAGWYRAHVGEVVEVTPGPERTVVTRVRADDGSVLEVPANFVIDATGLEGSIRDHRLLADLLDHSGAELNPLGRLDVDRDFAVRGAASEPGALYASGAVTLGSHYAGVDSFLGLQYAALRIADDLARRGFCRRIGTGRSLSEWWRWARNRPPGGERRR